MRFDVMSLFPQLVCDVLAHSITGRAQERGIFSVVGHDIRDHTDNKWRRVDDSPYGGGDGMLMQIEPIANCFSAICKSLPARPHLIYLSPKGAKLTQQRAIELARLPYITLLCGHYEGVDERVVDSLVDEELSIGDYVLTGGEIPAMVLIDSVARMLPGVLASESGAACESHYDGLLEYPQYTRPEVYEGMAVPPVLLSGHHANVEAWRREQQLRQTLKKRPELLECAPLSKWDKACLARIRAQEGET